MGRLQILKDLLLRAPLVRDAPNFEAACQQSLYRTIMETSTITEAVVDRTLRLSRLRDGLKHAIASLLSPAVFLLASQIGGGEWGVRTCAHALFLLVSALLGFVFVRVGHLQLLENAVAIVDLTPEEADCHRMEEKYETEFRMSSQVVMLGVVAVLCCVGLYALGVTPDSLPGFTTYLCWIWSVGLAIGNGVYWAVLTPQVAYFTTNSEKLGVDRYQPAETPGIRALSTMLASYALMSSVTFVCIISTFLLVTFDGHRVLQIRIAACAGTLGLVVVFIAFVYPQSLLVKAARKVRLATERALIQRQAKIGMTEDGRGDELLALQKVLDRVRESRVSPIGARVLMKYVGSVLIPLIVFVGGNLDLGQAIASLLGY